MSPESRAVDVPIVRVTLTEDRALVQREGRLAAWPGGGTVALHLPEVAPLLVDASLQVELSPGFALGRAAVVRRWVPRDSAADTIGGAVGVSAAALEQQIGVLRAAVEQVAGQRGRALVLVRRYAEQVAWAATRQDASAAPQADAAVAGWQAELERLEGRVLAALADETAQREGLRTEEEALRILQAAREVRRVVGWRLRAELHLSVEGDAAQAGQPLQIGVRYLTPAALWRPTYQAELADGRLTLATMATVWQRTGEDWPGVALILSTARPSAGATLPPLHHDALRLRDKTTEERRTITAAFRDQVVQKASLADGEDGDGDEGLPGVADGGEVQQLQAAAPTTVPSDGRPRRVAVSSHTVPVQPTWICLPERKALVFGRVELTNPARGPLLAGPVALICDGGPAGVTEIPFVAAGERFTLSLGSQDDVAVRYTRRAELEKRLALSDRRWLVQEVELTNTGLAPLEVELILRIPVSELAQVRVVLDREGRTSPEASGPDAQGFLRWQVVLPPDQPLKRQAAFRLDKDSNVSLPDPW